MLRDNQVEPVEKGVAYFKSNKPVPSIIVAPTAFGKSWLIAEISHRLGEKMLIIQPSIELLEQNFQKIKLLGGNASIFSAGMGVKEIGDITYATLGSIKNLGERFRGYKVILDECHLYPRGTDGMLRKFLESATTSHVLGLTATPLKLQTNSFQMQAYSMLKILTSRSKTGNFFKEIIHVAQIKEMVDFGYWCPLTYEIHDFSTGQLVFNTTRAEYTEESLRQAYIDQHIEDRIVLRLKTLHNRKSILIFVPTVADAHELSKKIPGSEVVWGSMPKKERKRIITGFKDLSIRIVINVNVLSVGFDHPQLDCIIAGRATASLAWWYQALGRLTRIFHDKEDGLIIDFSGNTQKFGRIEDLYYNKEKIWKLYGQGGVLLTGIAMDEIGKHIENPRIIVHFGTQKGIEVKNTPRTWRKWALENITWDRYNKHIKEEILKLQYD